MITLSIPLEKGREQRNPMHAVTICNTGKWQVQHWRTLVSVYRRAPFFEHYEHSLQPLFERHYERLIDFNLASIQWLQQQLKLAAALDTTEDYQPHYEHATDLRNMKRSKEQYDNLPVYYQLFEERNGFIPNLSMLDLLFAEGPAAKRILIQEN